MPEQSLETQHVLRKFDYLVGQKNSLEKLHVEHWKGHDQAILTLSSAILGLSFAFSHQVPRPLIASWALYGAWSAFVFAVIATVVSFRLGDADALWHIAYLDQQIARIREEISPGATPTPYA